MPKNCLRPGSALFNNVLHDGLYEVELRMPGPNLWIGNEGVLEIFRFARNHIKQINMSTRTSMAVYKCRMADQQLKKLTFVLQIYVDALQWYFLENY